MYDLEDLDVHVEVMRRLKALGFPSALPPTDDARVLRQYARLDLEDASRIPYAGGRRRLDRWDLLPAMGYDMQAQPLPGVAQISYTAALDLLCEHRWEIRTRMGAPNVTTATCQDCGRRLVGHMVVTFKDGMVSK